MSRSQRYTLSTATILAVLAALSLGACASSNTTTATDPAAALVIYGSGATSGASLNGGGPDSGAVTGAAASLTVTMYRLYISVNADCSSPILVQDLGNAGVDKDFMTGPELFEGSPAAGNYPCVMFNMSDVLRMKPATTFGACVAGTEYAGDIYRDGDSSWVDVNLNHVIGHGTDDVPVDDYVTIFMTRDTSAAIARGINTHQVLPLGSSMVVPGQSTFHMDASNAVESDGTRCGLQPPSMSFH